MKILPRWLLVLWVCGLVLVSFWVSLLVSSPVRADVGVQPILPGGSSIQPEEETPIQMAAERVKMTVRPATEADNAVIQLNPDAYGLQFQPVWFQAMADVEADFAMKNPTTETVSMTAWFPLASALENVGWELNPDEIVPRIESFQVMAGGDSVDYTVSELPNPKGEDKPLLPWASFPITFPASQETNIHVSYTLPLQPYPKGDEMALYYIFQTGAGWAGPIGQAELILNLPYPASPETLAGTPSGSLNLPYERPEGGSGEPSSGVLEGNQARWTWKDFEPGPQDDFAVWLIQPQKWQELESARAAVQAKPQDGQAWLDLASIYRSLSTSGYNMPSFFSTSYLTLGIEAYQKAADLLPEHPAPHAGLALLTLAPYMDDKNAPPDVIQSVQDEFKLARELEAKQPSLAEETGISSWILEDTLNNYFYNDATATADWATYSADWATETAVANLTLTPPPAPATPTPPPSRTPTPTATETLEASPTIEATLTPVPSEAEAGGGVEQALIAAAIIVLIIAAAYLVLRRK
jgi:hypothetical protein